MKQNLKKYLERKHYENNSKYEKVQAKNIGRKKWKEKGNKNVHERSKIMKKIPKIKKVGAQLWKDNQRKKRVR